MTRARAPTANNKPVASAAAAQRRRSAAEQQSSSEEKQQRGEAEKQSSEDSEEPRAAGSACRRGARLYPSHGVAILDNEVLEVAHTLPRRQVLGEHLRAEMSGCERR